MPILIYLALLGWIPLTVGLFAILPPRRAAVASVVGGQLFLPPASIPISGLPDYDKWTATAAGVVLATLIFQPSRLLEFRLRWFDLPVLGWFLAPIMASLQNGLGLYDGISGAMTCSAFWTCPYLIGRLYFTDHEGLRELAIGIVCGGLVYLPLIMLELRLSPIFKGLVYGIYQWEGLRFGSYRPFVFLTTGLELGMLMTGVSLSALWLWRSGALKRVASIPFAPVLLPLILIVTVLCRSSGAILLLIGGFLILWICTHFNTKIPFFALLLITPLYYGVRIPGLWTGANLVQLVEQVNPDRAQSLGYRFQCENVLIGKAMEQPIFGWGSWGRNRVKDENGRDWAVTDGVWIIYLGQYGCFGLFSWTGILLLAPCVFGLRHSVDQWKTPEIGPSAAIAVLLGLYIIDCLLNGFINQIYVTAAGGLVAALPADSRRKGRKGSTAGLHSRTESNTSPPDGEGSAAEAALLHAWHDSNPVEPNLTAPPSMQLAQRYQELARRLRVQGLLDDAKDAWLHALELFTEASARYPELANVQRSRCACANDFAWFLIHELDAAARADSQLAVRLARETTKAFPEAAAYWNTLGAAFFQAGLHHDAIAALERSIALSEGGTGFDYLFLALAHSRLGQAEQALQWKTRAELWMREHGCHHPELRRLHEQAWKAEPEAQGRSTEITLA